MKTCNKLECSSLPTQEINIAQEREEDKTKKNKNANHLHAKNVTLGSAIPVAWNEGREVTTRSIRLKERPSIGWHVPVIF